MFPLTIAASASTTTGAASDEYPRHEYTTTSAATAGRFLLALTLGAMVLQPLAGADDSSVKPRQDDPDPSACRNGSPGTHRGFAGELRWRLRRQRRSADQPGESEHLPPDACRRGRDFGEGGPSHKRPAVRRRGGLPGREERRSQLSFGFNCSPQSYPNPYVSIFSIPTPDGFLYGTQYGPPAADSFVRMSLDGALSVVHAFSAQEGYPSYVPILGPDATSTVLRK
jgi:hypothetical protein